MFQLLQAVLLVADEEATGSNAGPIGGLFFVLMALASLGLWWNMNSRLKRMERNREQESEKD